VDLLPIFPLELVLFPETPLPLHIFEPRYKEMIGECQAQKAPFGVVRAVEKGLAEVGCTAEILEVTKRYDDGRLDILTEGRRRFEIRRSTRTAPSCAPPCTSSTTRRARPVPARSPAPPSCNRN
jgi:Lon protease-like protein